MIRFYLIAGFFAVWGLSVMLFRWGLRRHMKKLMVVVGLWSLSASAFTVGWNGPKTLLSDGTDSDAQAAANYLVTQAQPGWSHQMGTNSAAITEIPWTNLVVFQCTNLNYLSKGSNIVFKAMSGGATHIMEFRLSAYPNLTVVGPLTFTTDGTGPSSQIIYVTGPGRCVCFGGLGFTNATMPTKFCVKFSNVGTGVGGPYGVVSNWWAHSSGAGPGIFDLHDQGIGSWSKPMTVGSADALYIESGWCFAANNLNQGAGVFDGYDGCRLVYRYNLNTNYTTGDHGPNSGPGVGSLQSEAYSNLWTYPYAGGSFSSPFVYRGGFSATWGETVQTFGSNPLATFIQWWVECASTQWAVEHCPSQLMYPADYPNPEQVGRGVVGGVQGLFPCYAWYNDLSHATFADFGFGQHPYQLGLDSGDAPFIVQGRDVNTNSVMPGYTAYVYPYSFSVPSSIARITTLRVGKAVVAH